MRGGKQEDKGRKEGETSSGVKRGSSSQRAVHRVDMKLMSKSLTFQLLKVPSWNLEKECGRMVKRETLGRVNVSAGRRAP